MEMTHSEIEKIKKEIKEEIMLLVVSKEDCSDIQGAVNNKLFNDDKRIEIITHDFAVVKKLMWAVASASIGSLVVAFFELILK